MPLVKIEIRKGKDINYKKAVLEGVHRALVDSMGIPEEDRFQRLYELDAADFEAPPDRSDDIVIIELSMFPGRSLESKRRLYKCIVDNLEEDPGINGHDIMIIIFEPPMTNWGVRGGQPASEVNFDFDIEI